MTESFKRYNRDFLEDNHDRDEGGAIFVSEIQDGNYLPLLNKLTNAIIDYLRVQVQTGRLNGVSVVDKDDI